MTAAMDNGQGTMDNEDASSMSGTKVDAESALHYLRASLNKYPPYTVPLADGRPRMVAWDRLSGEERSAQLQGMQDLLDWLAAQKELGNGVAGLSLPTCPECGHENEDWPIFHPGMEEQESCCGCGKIFLCTMFEQVTFTCRRAEA